MVNGDLIRKLEAATEGSRELDAMIAYHVVASTPGITMHEDSKCGDDVFAFWQDGVCHNCSRWEPFTTSLDAALTLVPEGYIWCILKLPSGHFNAAVTLPSVPPFVDEPDMANPALALCIACLKARQSRHSTPTSHEAQQQDGEKVTNHG